MTLSASEINKRHREKMKKKSLCVNCGKPLDRKGVLCEKCREHHTENTRQTREFYKQYGLCPRCGKNKLFGDEKSCLECAANAYEKIMKKRREKGIEHYNKLHSEWEKKERAKREENGLCVRCGKRKADVGYKTCGICREKIRNYKRKQIVSVKRDEWEANGGCFFCGEPVKTGYKVCEKHYQMNIEKLNNDNAKEATERMKKDNKIFYVKK